MPANDKPTAITSVLHEERIFPPPKEFSKRAHIKSLARVSQALQRIHPVAGEVLGQAGEERTGLVQALEEGAAMEGAVRQMVRRRPTQCQLSIAWTDGSAPPHANKAALIWEGEPAAARQARARSARSPTSSFIAKSAASPMSSSETASRRATASSSTCRWCPKPPLPCSPARASAPCTRSCSAGSARNPSPTASRIRRPSWSSPPTAASGAARSCRSRRTWTKRSRSKTPQGELLAKTIEKVIVLRRAGQRSRSSRRAAMSGGIEELEQVECALPGGEDGQRSAAVHSLHQRLDRQTQGHPAHHRRLSARREADDANTSSICATKTFTGARPTSAGSPATATSSMARWRTARRA